MRICCLDMEGVLVPEIWINVARRFKLSALRLTTRDIPDYDRLMRYRIGILKKEGITLRDIQKVIRTMKPLAGAKSFLDALRKQYPVIILSDTFYEFAAPLIKRLGNPVLFCNDLRINKAGFISGYQLRQKDGKRKAVKALKQIGFETLAVGDSFNDLTMLREARYGILFNPPANIAKKNRSLPVLRNYSALLKKIRSL